MNSKLPRDLKALFSDWNPEDEIPQTFYQYWLDNVANKHDNKPRFLSVKGSENIGGTEREVALFIPMGKSTYVGVLYYGGLRYVSLCQYIRKGKNKGRKRTTMLSNYYGRRLIPSIWPKTGALSYMDQSCGESWEVY